MFASSKENKTKCIHVRLQLWKSMYKHRIVLSTLSIIIFLIVLTYCTESINISNTVLLGGYRISFIVIGDWGVIDPQHPDYDNKLQVAQAMHIIQQQLSTSFVISVGDQYYETGVQLKYPLAQLNKTSDLSYWFTDHFESVYNKSLAPWYLILGERDMRGSVQALFAYQNISNRWNLPYNYYYKDFSVSYFKSIRVLFIDTTSIMCHHNEKEKDSEPDALETFASICNDAWYFSEKDKKSQYNEQDEHKFVKRNAQLQWMKDTILNADSDYRISNILIMGHHCLWSQGPHGCPLELGTQLRPLLELSKKIKGYFCGHNHGLEHFKWIQKKKRFQVHSFTVGSGAMLHDMNEGRCDVDEWLDSTNVNGKDKQSEIDLEYLGVSRGFATVHFEKKSITVKFWNQTSDLLYEANI